MKRRWPPAPPGFALRADERQALYVREEDEGALERAGLGRFDGWRDALARGAPASGRGSTAVVSASTGTRWRLKMMRRGGLLASLWRDRYLSPDRAVAMLGISEQARSAGVPTARPVALIVEAGRGGTVRAAAAFEEIESSEDLAQRARRGALTREDLLVALRAVRLMHDRGFHHRDLNLGNILVYGGQAGGPQAFVVDFDRAVRSAGPRPFADRQEALRRLERSCAKLTGSPAPLGPGSENLWYALYADGDSGLASRFARGRAVGRLALAVHRLGWRNKS